MSQHYEKWQERQRFRCTRRVTVQMEISESYDSFMRLDVIIDGSYHVNALSGDPHPDYSTAQLYKTLIDVLDKYQPRETIEGSVEMSQGEE